jgi:hypothetical protein
MFIEMGPHQDQSSVGAESARRIENHISLSRTGTYWPYGLAEGAEAPAKVVTRFFHSAGLVALS